MSTAVAGHYLLGSVGLALLRTWFGPDAAAAARRVDEMRRFAGDPEAGPMGIRMDLRELDVVEGYARWATSYDAAPNPLIRVEEPVVHAMIDRAPPGVALDAACGTGRHAAYLLARGHRVVGVDATPEMLAKARARVPGADFRVGDLRRLPVEAASVDLAVCALALTHLPDLAPAVDELARVVRPGGRLVVSDFHPTMLLLGGTGFFVAEDGTPGNVRSFRHPHARYLAAFRRAGLDVVDCVEPALEEDDLSPLSGGMSTLAEEAFRTAWVGVPNALVWELVRRG
jgi:ubiquinone/menaquinone biosynthesis C-methylase UbiE